MRLITTLILTVVLFISPVLISSGAFGATPLEAAEKPAPEMPFIKDANGVYPGKFLLKKAGSQYEPDPEDKFSDKSTITIPGTELTAGVFDYKYINERGEDERTSKAGVLINDSIYYVDTSGNNGAGDFDMSGGQNVGIYKNYLTMDSSEVGGTSYRGIMFLFKYTKNSVELLDVIRDYNFSFSSVTEPVHNKKERGPWWTKIADIDHDGNPEFKIWISHSFKFEEAFQLFLEIRDDKLRVNFNPELYKPLFKEIERENRMKTEKPEAYYIYGFLSRKLNLKKITAMLAGKEDPDEKLHYIINILKKRDTWDADFHHLYGVKPVLIKHNLKNETGGK